MTSQLAESQLAESQLAECLYVGVRNRVRVRVRVRVRDRFRDGVKDRMLGFGELGFGELGRSPAFGELGRNRDEWTIVVCRNNPFQYSWTEK